jgi:hypothetical protein
VTADALGDARVDEHTRSGVLATVYVDRVEELARAARVDVGMLLGRALAHELGHLLMGGLHGVSGLMRPSWTREEVRRNAAADWMFAGGELLAMRAGAEPF